MQLSQGFIKQLYQNRETKQKIPTVQLLDFEESQANDKEIIIRISDKDYFIDCTLSGSYQINNNKIFFAKTGTNQVIFKRNNVVQLIDYFSKIDTNKISKLKIIIRKLNQSSDLTEQIGKPVEIHQHMINNRLTSILQNKAGISKPDSSTIKKSQETNSNKNLSNIKIESFNEDCYANFDKSIKIQERKDLINQSNHNKNKKELNEENNNLSDSSLTLNDIMEGKDGYLIGRLIRFKNIVKDTKEGPMTVCYLGMLNKYNELVRVHLAGRMALNNEKILKKNKCYYIRGFDLVSIKNSGKQIRLKDKEYKISQIMNQEYHKSLGKFSYNWDHQNQILDEKNEYVDVIGCIQDIQQKTTYSPNNPQDPRSVVRVVLKNIYKTIRISFWTDQIRVLESFNLKKKDFIIIEDVRKKHSKYYDFSFESTLINVHKDQELYDKFIYLLPEDLPQAQPSNIRELALFYDTDPNNSKLQTIQATLYRLHDMNVVFRICQDCKKRVDKNGTQCHQCGSGNLNFKYNCLFQFSDSTGSIICLLFDNIANSLLGINANNINKLSQIQLIGLVQNLYYKTYNITIENRNNRLIIRSLDLIDEKMHDQQTKLNLVKIKQIIGTNH